MIGLEQAIFQRIVETGTFVLKHNNMEVKEVIIKLKAQGFINNPYTDKSKFIAVGEGLQVVLHKGWDNYQSFLNTDLETSKSKAENIIPNKKDNTDNKTNSLTWQLWLGIAVTVIGGLLLAAIIYIISNFTNR